MYVYVRGIDFVRFYDFSIIFWSFFRQCGNLLFFILILHLYLNVLYYLQY